MTILLFVVIRIVSVTGGRFTTLLRSIGSIAEVLLRFYCYIIVDIAVFATYAYACVVSFDELSDDYYFLFTEMMLILLPWEFLLSTTTLLFSSIAAVNGA